MTTIYQYRLFCITATTNEYVWAESSPTKCPSNTLHTIDTNSITIVDKLEPNIVVVREEDVPTGGHFGCHTVSMNITASTTGIRTSYFPMPVSVLSVEFIAEEQNRGDTFSLGVFPDTVYGILTNNTITSTHWTPQNYNVNDIAFFYDRNYKCIKAASSTDLPASVNNGYNMKYWLPEPYTLNVSSTVVNNIKLGFHVKLDDGIKTEKLGRVAKIDKTNSTISVEIAPTQIFLASSPTYIKVTTYLIWNYELGAPWERGIGETKIGGAYLPANTPIQLEYVNTHANNVYITGHVEYLY